MLRVRDDGKETARLSGGGPVISTWIGCMKPTRQLNGCVSNEIDYGNAITIRAAYRYNLALSNIYTLTMGINAVSGRCGEIGKLEILHAQGL
jgi:hypothetical protein